MVWISPLSACAAAFHPPAVGCCEDPNNIFSITPLVPGVLLGNPKAIPPPGWSSPGPTASPHRVRAPAPSFRWPPHTSVLFPYWIQTGGSTQIGSDEHLAVRTVSALPWLSGSCPAHPSPGAAGHHWCPGSGPSSAHCSPAPRAVPQSCPPPLPAPACISAECCLTFARVEFPVSPFSGLQWQSCHWKSCHPASVYPLVTSGVFWKT